jgi:YidC/Oxa1 family membrane protein insertase
MEKRILLAVTLSFLVLFAFQNLLVRRAPEPPPAAPTAEAPVVPAAPPGELAAGARPTAVAPDGDAAPAVDSGAAVVVGDTAVREILVETPVVRAVFNNQGGHLVSWELKAYQGADGRPVNLIPLNLLAGHPRPFSLAVEDAQVMRALNEALYQASAAELRLGSEPADLSFEYRDEAGLAVRKTFSFDPARPYVIGFRAAVARNGEVLNPAVRWGPGLGDAPAETSMYIQQSQAIFSRDGDESRLDAGKLQRQPVYDGVFDFAGIDDHYFLVAALVRGQQIRVTYDTLTVPTPDGGTRGLVTYAIGFASPPERVEIFAGPKDFDVLAATDRDLVRAIHFGWFAFLVVPLLRSLKWINGFVGNYGWSIIILTILINLAMFPLRHKSVVSMRKMQELQPEVKAIQERYSKVKATDPARQKMNVELMNLYRERGVNPASGCLPMLLTMPVLFAFYSLLSVAIEIRGAPFVLWIQDLSRHDPLYVTPILMGLTMVWQQKMTPTTADPMQQKIMMFMPIMFTVMFLWAPSGLVLYWLVSNLWGIGQQQITNRIIGPPVLKAVRPAAERRVKRVGSGRSEQAGERA